MVAFQVFCDSHYRPCRALVNEVLPDILNRDKPWQVMVDSCDVEPQGELLVQRPTS